MSNTSGIKHEQRGHCTTTIIPWSTFATLYIAKTAQSKVIGAAKSLAKSTGGENVESVNVGVAIEVGSVDVGVGIEETEVQQVER